MAESEANRTDFSYGLEASFGAGFTGNLQRARIKSESITLDKNTKSSEELRADGQISDVVVTSSSVTGDIPFEVSYSQFLNDFFKMALKNDWTTGASITASTLSFVSSDNSINDSGSGFDDTELKTGMIVKIVVPSGANAGTHYARISKTTAPTTGKVIFEYPTFLDQADGVSITMKNSGMLRNGVTDHSFYAESDYTDITQIKQSTGCKVGGFELTFNAEDIATGTFNILGKSQDMATSSSGSGYIDAETNKVMNCSSDVKGLYIDGTLSTNCFTSASINFSNSPRLRPCTGQETAVSIGHGARVCTVSRELYFKDDTLFNKYVNNTSQEELYIVEDADGNAYTVLFNKLIPTSVPVTTEGIDTDNMISAEFQAVGTDLTVNCTIQIDKFEA